jgi:hypothetical protein
MENAALDFAPTEEQIDAEIKQRIKDAKIRELWLRGNLRYKLHSGQLKIREAVKSSPTQLFVG